MKIKESKNNKLMMMLKNSIMDLPTPSSISFMWNMGFLLGMTLIMQIVTGMFLSMLYTAQTETAFKIMIMIMRDINMGWITRIMHMNGASLLFMIMYIHTARGMYFSSPSNKPKVWISGMIMMMMIMATAFLGYVLPWGQMSFWGATVITGVMSAIPIIGNDLTTWVWGGSAVAGPTLNRFFSLHFMIPMMTMVMVMIHLILLHEKGSSNPSNTHTNTDKIKFNPLFMMKDILPMTMIMLMMMIVASNNPNMVSDVENFNPANPMVAPIHIQPEWYFLFAYVILRSIPSKLGGVIALMMSILVMMVLVTKKEKSSKFKTNKKIKFWFMVSVMLILTWIGTKTVESPFEEMGKIYTILYFMTIYTLCFLQSPWKPVKESFLEN